jgi:uncharacterized protein YqhQ
VIHLSNEKKPAYGGQAVLEGVMMAGKRVYVTAIRRKDNSIEYYEIQKKERDWVKRLKRIPILRGNVALIEASANGSKHLNFSTERFDVDPNEDDQIVTAEQSSKLTMILGVAAVGVLSFLFSKFIFTAIPAVLAEMLRPWFPGHIEQNIIEGIIKVIFLLSYIYLISLAPIVKRVFQYHGAEHKVINCYEDGKDLTTKNVQSSSRFHYRCGSSFILFTVMIGVIVYMLVPSEPLLDRILYRLLLLPVVIGISFEVLQLTNKVRDIPGLRYLGYPGLWVQKLTTKEPTDDQAEVAIASFTRMLEREKELAALEQQVAKIV